MLINFVSRRELVASAFAVVFVAACSSDPPAPTGRDACKQSLDQYCASATNPICVRAIDPNNTVGSYCAQAGPGPGFGIGSCTAGEIVIYSTDTSIYYDSSGQLVATYRQDNNGSTCLAGPTRYTPPARCRSLLLAYSCGVADAGLDAIAE